LWLSLFKAETEEELAKIEELEVPIMKQAINAYHSITVSPEFHELQRIRDRASHDEAQALYNAMLVGEARGRAEGEAKALAIIRNMLKRNRSVDEIMEDTGLTREEIERLRSLN